MNNKLFNLLINALVLFTAVPVHECAHAWTAEKLGDDTGRRQGRITLNPFAHLSLWGSIMLIFVGFGWGKPVQTNPNNFKSPKKGMALTAFAGPASNLIMSYLAMAVYKILIYAGNLKQSDVIITIAEVFGYITIINISLAVFNLLPVPPLDGSKIFGAVLPEKYYFKIMRYERYIALAVIILFYSGLLDTPLGFLQKKAFSVMLFLTGWVELLFNAILS